MSNYSYIVPNSEAEALKEMIFKRVRERAEALNEETQNSYMTSAKFDVMELAKESFEAPRNPFSMSRDIAETSDSVKTEDEPEKIKQARVRAAEIRKQIDSNNKTVSEKIADKEALDNMNQAREALTKKTSFIGALDFLNSQATISLVSKTGSKFAALA